MNPLPPRNPRTVASFRRNLRRSAALLFLAASCALPGCRGPRVLSGEEIQRDPVPAGLSTAELLHAANATPRAVSSFASACRLSLVTPDGKTANLDGALIASESPGGNSLRLQAWKFDRPVIDLTVTPAGRFLFVRGQDEKQDIPAGFASIPPGGLPTLAPLLTELPEERGTPFTPGVFKWPMRDFGVSADATLLAALSPEGVESIAVLGPDGDTLQTIGFANFRSLDGVAWPMDWTLTGKLTGTVLLEDVELNADLPAAAFEPAANARAF